MKLAVVAFSFFLICSHSIQARRPYKVDTKSYEYMFPRGIQGRNWFAQGAYSGNKLELITTGTQVYRRRLQLLREATRSILISTYIYAMDSSANTITNLLCQKAKQGVDVRILVESIKSKGFYKKKEKILRKCGVGIILFAPGRWDMLDFVKAMHEKLFIVDGSKMMMGGNGIENSYHNIKPAERYFYDLDLYIEGPAACWWHFQFIENYKMSRVQDRPKAAFRNKRLDEYLYGSREYPVCYPLAVGDSNVYPVYGNSIFYPKKTPIEDAYLKAFAQVKKGATVRLYAPYFVPTKRLVKAMIKAVKKRKVKIQVMTNSIRSNDEGWPTLIGMAYTVRNLLKNGIKIKGYKGPRTLHRKAGVFGKSWAYIGSDNLDGRAQHYNTETVSFTDDDKIIKELKFYHQVDWKNAIEINESYLDRILREHPSIKRWAVDKILPYI